MSSHLASHQSQSTPQTRFSTPPSMSIGPRLLAMCKTGGRPCQYEVVGGPRALGSHEQEIGSLELSFHRLYAIQPSKTLRHAASRPLGPRLFSKYKVGRHTYRRGAARGCRAWKRTGVVDKEAESQFPVTTQGSDVKIVSPWY